MSELSLIRGLSRVGLVTSSLAISGLTTLAINVVAARELERGAYAQFALLLAAGLAIAQAPASALTPVLMRKIARVAGEGAATGGLLRTALLTSLVAGTALSGAAVALLPWLEVRDLPLLLLLGVAYAQYVVSKNTLIATGRTSTFLTREIALDATLLVGIAGSLALTDGYRPLVWTFTGIYVGFVAVWTIVDSLRGGTSTGRLDRSDLTFGGWSFLATYASVAFFPLVIALAGSVMEPEALAGVAAAVALTTPLLLIPQAVGALTFVDFSRAAGGSETRWLALHVYASAVLAGAACIAVLIVGGSPAAWVLGDRYTDMTTPLLLVTAAIAIRCVAPPLGAALSAQHRYRASTVVVVAAMAIGVAALYGLDRAGVEEPAAWALLCGAVALAAPLLVLATSAFALPRYFAATVLACPAAACVFAGSESLDRLALASAIVCWLVLAARCLGAATGIDRAVAPTAAA